MTTKISNQGKVYILSVTGILSATSGIDESLAEVFKQAKKFPKPKIIINLKKCQRINSSVLASVLRTRAEVKKLHGSLVLSGGSESVLNLMRVTGLCKVLKHYRSLHTAINDE